MIKRYCDRCGKTIGSYSHLVYSWWDEYEGDDEDGSGDYDLCISCVKLVVKFIEKTDVEKNSKGKIRRGSKYKR